MYSFDEYFNKCSDKHNCRYCKDTEDKLNAHAQKMATAKAKEAHHKIDCFNEEKRIMTGLLGEKALEHVLGIDIIDYTIGNSKNYNVPDISQYNIGVKTVEYGKFPVIFKNNSYPQIICVVDKSKKAVYVLGLATVDVLNKYQSEDLILSPYLRARGTKTGFYGLDKLIPIHSIEDILKYKQGAVA